MEVWEYILGVAMIVLSIIMIVIILMQDSRAEGLSGAIAGGAETFFGKNRGRSVEARLGKITKVLCGIFVALSLIMTLLIGFFGS